MNLHVMLAYQHRKIESWVGVKVFAGPSVRICLNTWLGACCCTLHTGRKSHKNVTFSKFIRNWQIINRYFLKLSKRWKLWKNVNLKILAKFYPWVWSKIIFQKIIDIIFYLLRHWATKFKAIGQEFARFSWDLS